MLQDISPVLAARIELRDGPRKAASRQHERRESNPQPPVLETGALPIELRSYLRHHVQASSPSSESIGRPA